MLDGGQSEGDFKPITYRQTRLERDDLEWLRCFTENHRNLTLGELVAEVCQRFGWRRPNGTAPISSCSVFLRRLERQGLIALPRPPRVFYGKGQGRHEWADEVMFLEALGPVAGMVECQPSGSLSVRPIFTEEAAGFRLHLQRYHYLGFERPVGESLGYAALLGDELVALLSWGAAVLHNGPRDRHIGWDRATKARRLPWVVNNRRFLMLPWIVQPHLASRILAANLRRLSRDWEAVYEHPVWLAETFVDTSRFRGTCYRASNWRYLGETRGYSRSKTGFHANHRPKAVFVYPLHRHACELLCAAEETMASGSSPCSPRR